MDTLLTVILIVAPVVILTVGVFIFNRLVRDRNLVLTAWSDIDIQLKRRYDLIPKLVAAVDQYARYEQSTLQTLIELRSQTTRIENPQEKGPIEAAIGGGLRKLIALAESYPELKADQSFIQLQTDISEVEDYIQYSRRFYNGAVRKLNTRIETFPDLIVARFLNFRPQPLFELNSSAEKHSPEIFKS